MESSIQLKLILVKEEGENVFRCNKDSDRWNYIPGDLDSMRSAIDSATEYLESRRQRWAESNISVGSVKVILTRGDGTIINEIDGDHIKTASEIINEMCIV